MEHISHSRCRKGYCAASARSSWARSPSASPRWSCSGWPSGRRGRWNSGSVNFQDQGFELVDQTGVPRANADFAGAPIALFFGYTYCPDVCPMTLTLLSTSLDEVAEQGIDTSALQTIFITVDAERDTPEQLAAYLSLFDLPVTGLTGTKRAACARA